MISFLFSANQDPAVRGLGTAGTRYGHVDFLLRSPLSATWRRVEKVRLDRASGGQRRVEVAIVYKLIKFSTIPGNAQTF